MLFMISSYETLFLCSLQKYQQQIKGRSLDNLCRFFKWTTGHTTPTLDSQEEKEGRKKRPKNSAERSEKVKLLLVAKVQIHSSKMQQELMISISINYNSNTIYLKLA